MVEDATRDEGAPAPETGWVGDLVLRARRAVRRVADQTSGRPWYRRPLFLGVVALLLVVTPAVLAYVLAAAQPDVYVARGEVLFSVEDAFVDESTSETLALIGRSNRVLTPVSEELGIPLGEIQDSLSTAIVGTTTVVVPEVRRSDPQEAEEITRAVMQEWVAAARQPDTATTAGLAAAIERQTARLGEVQADLSGEVDDDLRALLEGERDALFTEIGELQGQLETLEGNDLFLGHSAEILSPPSADDTPVEPKPLESAIAGVVIGLLLAGAVLAVAWQLSLREPSDRMPPPAR